MTDAAPVPSSAAKTAKLLIAIPCLNEEAHLPTLLPALARQAGEGDRIVVVDGGSRDRSVEIVQAFAATDPRVSVLHNPKRIQAAAINLAATQLGEGADYLIRVDAHAGYPEGYCATLVAASQEWDADSVTVAMRARAHSSSCFQIADAAAQNSALGAGGSPHRSVGGRRWVDHGHHALFRMAAFRDAGGYDESFSHNEDAELDARLTAAGRRILLAGDIVIDYYPRSTASALWRQYYAFGRGRARMILQTGKTPKLRQLAPLAIAPAVVLAIGAPLLPWVALPLALWLLACLGYGVLLGAREQSLCAAAAGLPAAVMHLAWSTGFWSALLLRTRKNAAP